MKQNTSTSQPFIPGLLLLVALCLYSLLRTPFTTAEATLLARARAPVSELIGSPYSPLYLLLLHFWSALGENPVWLRLLSIFCGLAALPLSQRVVRGLGGAHAVPGALLLLGAAPLLVIQASRLSSAPAGLVALLCCFVCFLEFTRAGDGRWLAGWLVAVVAAWGIHAGFFWVVVAQWLIMLYYRERFRSRQLIWWLAQILPLALLLWRSGPILRHSFVVRLPAAFDFSLLFETAAALARVSTGLPLSAGLLGGLLLTFLLLSGLWGCRDWRRDPRHGLLVLSLVLPCLVYLLAVRSDSYLLMPLLCWCTLASMGLRHFPRWMRQMLWSTVAVAYLWSYWRLLG